MKKSNKKQKLNPIMTDGKKLKKVNLGSSSDDDENVIKKFIIIVIVLVVAVAIVFGVTELLKKDDKGDSVNAVTSGVVNYDITSVGTILNRPYDEYYVMIYDSENSKSMVYSTIMSKYSNKEDALKIYFCDLNNSLNKPYYNVGEDNISNPKAKNVNELDLGDLTLIKVKNNKIIKYVESYEEIKNLLS